MSSYSPISKLIILAIAVDVASSRGALESFRLCIKKHGVSPELVVQHSTGNASFYSELDHRWNTRPVHVHPLAYFVPRVTSDVQIGVRCARVNNISVIPKSGGHSAELLSFGNADTIVIAFQNMKKIQINARQKTAIIEPGALIVDIRQKLLNEGGFGLSTGSCDYVGIGGIALGGGSGPVSPIYNLTVDNILEMEMVDSNGDLHLVNKNVNSDLFWALCGVGSGYIGIVTSFKFKLFNATDLRTTHYSIVYDLESFVPVLLAYQKWLVWGENEGLIVRAYITASGYSIGELSVNFQLLEEISKGQPTNAPLFLNKINEMFPRHEGQEGILSFPSYEELARLASDEENIKFLSVKADPATYVKKKSFFVNRTFTTKELEKVAQTIQKSRNISVLSYYTGSTGPYNKIPATEMSYVHRGNLYLVSHRVVADAEVSYREAQLALQWLNEFDTESKIMDSGESYQNYVDLDLKDFMERYYGINSRRLMQIKKKWDPKNYFRNEQSIPIAKWPTRPKLY